MTARRFALHAAYGFAGGILLVALTGLVCAVLESDALKRVRSPRPVKPWLRGLR